MSLKNAVSCPLIVLAIAMGACDSSSEATVDVTEGEILNGSIDSTNSRNQTVNLGGCTGALVTNNWILTANHCVRSTATMTATYAGQSRTVVEVVRHPSNAGFVPQVEGSGLSEHQGIDVILLRVDPGFSVGSSTTGFSRPMWPGDSSTLANQSMDCSGYGWVDAAMTPATDLRYAVSSTKVEKDLVSGEGLPLGDLVTLVNTNPSNPAAGQLPMRGDSGGPCFMSKNGVKYRTYVQAATAADLTSAFGVSTATPAVRSWVDSTTMQVTTNASVRMYSNPVLSNQGPNNLDVFWVDTNRHLIQLHQSSGVWKSPVDLGTPPGVTLGGNKPAAVSWASGRIDVFVQATNNTVYQRYALNNVWQSGWFQIQTGVTTSPAVASWGANRLDFFGRGLNGELRHSYYDNGWHMVWEDLGGNMVGSPVATSWGPNRIDIAIRGTDNAVYRKSWNGAVWGDFVSLGGNITAGPAISSGKAGRLDVFARGTNGNLLHKWFEGEWLNDWIDTGIAVPGVPTATSWGAGHFDVDAINADGTLWQLKYPR